jgi:hypothetical protein
MSGNAQPQFTKQGNIGATDVTTARTLSDGTGTIGTNLWLAFTADATNGSYVEFARIMGVGSVAATATVATVIRLYVSSLASGATATTNTHLIAEVALPIITTDQTVTATNAFDVALGFRLPAGWTILASTHIVNAASTTWRVIVFGGDY